MRRLKKNTGLPKSSSEPERKGETNPSEMKLTTRRRFLNRVAVLALGGAASLNWLTACGETSTPAGAGSTAVSLSPSPITTAPTTPTPLSTTIATTTGSVATTSVPAGSVVATTSVPALSTATAVPVKPLKLLVFGDVRTDGPKPPEVYNKLVQLATAEKPDVVLLVGDIINAGNSKIVVKNQWANFREATAPLAPARLLPTIGNHDTNFMDWAEPLYLEAFAPDKLPTNGPENYLGEAYSLDLGPIHLVTVASEMPAHPHRLGTQQLAWLEKDLSANTQPYTLVMSHDPAYPFGPHKGSSLDAYKGERDTFWNLLKKYKVNAFICGHEHFYVRTQHEGITQIIAGASGSSLYLGYGAGEFQMYMLLTVTANGLNAKVVDSNGKERDTFNLG